MLTRRSMISGAAALVPACALLSRTRPAEAEGTCASPTSGDPEQRASLHYVEQSGDPKKPCESCMYFQSRGRCGSCRVVSGPVNPSGSCDSWSAKG